MFLSSLSIPESGMTAQRYRLDIIAQNITNAQTTRVENGEGPYRRKVLVFETRSGGTFDDSLKAASLRYRKYGPKAGTVDLLASGTALPDTGRGVRVTEVKEDSSPNKIVYDPTHPDADEEGYVEMPNVEMVAEMTDMMSASRSYESNIQVVNAIKAMASRALEIGR